MAEANLTPTMSDSKRAMQRSNQCPQVIGFRLPEEAREILAARALHLGRTPHLLAQHYVLLALMAPETLDALNERITALQKDLAAITEALLTHAGKVAEPDAIKWVNHNLRQCSPSPNP